MENFKLNHNNPTKAKPMTHDKHTLSEADTRAKYIDPVLDAIGWNKQPAHIRREISITKGRLKGFNGTREARKSADYILTFNGHKLAIIEAKKYSLPATEGRTQAIDYAERLNIRFAFCSNGQQIYKIDLLTAQETFVDAYPTPQELWDLTFAVHNEWRDVFALCRFYDADGKAVRPYQENAVNAVLNAIANNQNRILLTLATGTGKTMIALQIAWKLFETRFTLKRDKGRRPRILFLADRNILANQAYNNFSAFTEDARCRITPEQMRKHKTMPKNANIFFTIFQTFMTDDTNEIPCFYDYPPDFFDFIIIDECHRGGANDESSWRKILEYFTPAIQLGLTATPKRKINADSYAYFGEPVYVYSLKEGIDDGFLTPYKIEKYTSNIDDYSYCSADNVTQGQVDEDKIYTEYDMNKAIILPDREEYRVEQFLGKIKPYEKAIVFCVTQDHALMIRDFINHHKPTHDLHYAERVTASDGKDGETFLEYFQDNEKSIPTILTTSRKLSTGVDAPQVKHIILMRPIQSMIEFKQIIGRGTRLYDHKDYFTIHDFVNAVALFNDPEWDGEPLEPLEPINKPTEPDNTLIIDIEDDENTKTVKKPVIIQLSNKRINNLNYITETFLMDKNGNLVCVTDYLQQFYNQMPVVCYDETALSALWIVPQERKELINQFSENGYDLTHIQSLLNMSDSDLYDVLMNIAHGKSIISRKDRADKALMILKNQDYTLQLTEFLKFTLEQYILIGTEAIDIDNLPRLLELKYQTLTDAKLKLGDIAMIRQNFIEFQKFLYLNVFP